MIRRLFTVVAALSLLLMLASLYLWADRARYETPSWNLRRIFMRMHSLWVINDKLEYDTIPVTLESEDSWGYSMNSADFNNPSSAQIFYRAIPYPDGRHAVHALIALKYLWVPFAMLPMLWYVTRRRKPGPGTCVKCDYDLTANITGICPECGTQITAKQAISSGGLA